MGAQFLELLGQVHVVLQIVFGARGVEDVAGVADGGFADGADFQQGVDRQAHVVDGIEGIEDAEDVDALGVGLAQEFADEIRRIGAVADGVGAAGEHLEADVGDAATQFAQALPGVFVEETHGGVKGRAAPDFQAEQVGEMAGDGFGRGQEVVGADARGQQ